MTRLPIAVAVLLSAAVHRGASDSRTARAGNPRPDLSRVAAVGDGEDSSRRLSDRANRYLSGPDAATALANGAILALTANLPVRQERRLRVQTDVVAVSYPVVDLPDRVAEDDLSLRVRAVLSRLASGSLGWSHGRCVSTLATRELVSLVCTLTTATDRGSPARVDGGAVTFRLGANGAVRVDVTTAFVAGTQLAQAICAKALGRVPTGDDACYASHVDIALARDHLVGSWRSFARRGRTRSVNLPYAEIASLIRLDGPLAFAVGPRPATPTPALLAASPTIGQCVVYGEPMGYVALGEALHRSDTTHISLLMQDAGNGTWRLVGPDPRSALPAPVAALTDAVGPASRAPCASPRLQLSRRATVGATPLYDAPGGAVHSTLPPGVRLVAFDGVVEGYDSTNFSDVPGLWMFVVAEGAHGWVQSAVRLRYPR